MLPHGTSHKTMQTTVKITVVLSEAATSAASVAPCWLSGRPGRVLALAGRGVR